MRMYSWRRHNHPFSLSFLEEVLRWVGMNEVHKAVTLFLDTMAKLPGSPRTQRSLYREFLFLTLAAMGKDHVGKTLPVYFTDDITHYNHFIPWSIDFTLAISSYSSFSRVISNS